MTDPNIEAKQADILGAVVSRNATKGSAISFSSKKAEKFERFGLGRRVVDSAFRGHGSRDSSPVSPYPSQV